MNSTGAMLDVVHIVTRNIVPVIGIVLLGWSAQNTLLLYFADTVFAFAVLFAALIAYFHPVPTDDGWASRVNGEVGVVGGGLFLAVIVAIPLGIPLVFMLGGDVSLGAMRDDRGFLIGLAWQAAAAVGAYLELYRALRVTTPEALQLRRRFALVFLRWIALVMVAFTGIGMLLGQFGALLFVALYAAVTIVAEIAPDRFLRAMPGGAEDVRPLAPPTASMPRANPRPRRRRKR